MAEEKKSSSSGSGLSQVILFFIILFILWVITGGPQRNPESRNNQFMNSLGINGGDGQSYHDEPLGQPGSITRKIPFLK